MLETRLLAKMVEARTMWQCDWGNDAQGIVQQAILMATDTPWEDKLSESFSHEPNSYDQIKATFMANHPGATDDDIKLGMYPEQSGKLYWELTRMCEDNNNAWCRGYEQSMDSVIEELCDAIDDKVHRRNLQIADLKRESNHELQVKSSEYIALHRKLDKSTQTNNAWLLEMTAIERDISKGILTDVKQIRPRFNQALEVIDRSQTIPAM